LITADDITLTWDDLAVDDWPPGQTRIQAHLSAVYIVDDEVLAAGEHVKEQVLNTLKAALAKRLNGR
jgi:hypothetical protein